MAEARADFAALVGAVHDGAEPVVVEREGKPVVVMISLEQYDLFQAQTKERFFQAVEELHRRNAGADPDEVLRYVTEIVEEVRQERYERMR